MRIGSKSSGAARPVSLTDADWVFVLEVYGNACLACDKPEVTIDHVVPVSKGGRNEIDNVQPLCGRCNTSKGTKTIDYRRCRSPT